MNSRKFVLIVITLLLSTLAFVSVAQALSATQGIPAQANLANVRDFAPAPSADSLNYAVDGGLLYVGETGAWLPVSTPAGVVVNAVAQDSRLADVVYMGAANELTIYRSTDGGLNWQPILLSEQMGAVTDIAVDSVNHMVYVGTDSAGLFRLRDVGTSLISGGRLALDEPVVQVAVDNSGSGLAFVRTAWNLYRAENGGLNWSKVENLLSVPTALAIADTSPATVYVGTADRGVLSSTDGLTWQTANAGLGITPGSRLYVDALAVDPMQPEVVYVSSSFLFGSTQTHATSQGVAMSQDSAQAWTTLAPALDGNVAVVELLPVSGQPGAVFALAANSRTPLALGSAPTVPALAAAELVTAPTLAAQPAAPATNWLAWIVAALAGLALAFAVGTDLFWRWSRKPVFGKIERKPAAVPVGHK